MATPIPPTSPASRLVSYFSADPSTHLQKWNDLWNEKFTPWDQGISNPALRDTILSHPELFSASPSESGKQRRKRALVPGCGRGYDVFVLAEMGYEAWGLEGSRVAVDICRGEVGGKERVGFVQGDFFESGWEGECGGAGFDLIYDYTFLCAIPPSKRPDWALRISQLLARDGRLICIEFPTFKDLSTGGPPWGLKAEVYLELFKNPGGGVTYDDEGLVIVSGEEEGKKGLKRVGHWKADRTLSYGIGTDWVSVWGHV